MVRDHSWTIADPSPSSSAQTKGVVDPSFWPTKKERAKLVMDQRATSVADLSHIITRGISSAGQRSAREKGQDIARLKLWAKVQALASTPATALKSLEDERATLQSATDAPLSQKQRTAGGGGQAERSRLKKRKMRIAEITAQLNRLRKAREAVTFASGGEVAESQRAKWSKTLKYIVQQQIPDTPIMSYYSLDAAKARKEAQAIARPVNWPKSTKYDGDVHLPKALTGRDKIAYADYVPEVDSRPLKELPESSVLIQWANLPDAQFAEQWHADVVHEEMASKIVDRAARTHARIAREMDEVAELESGAEEVQRQPLGSKYLGSQGGVQAEQPADSRKTGWLGTLNPMRMFKSGEARA